MALVTEGYIHRRIYRSSAWANLHVTISLLLAGVARVENRADKKKLNLTATCFYKSDLLLSTCSFSLPNFGPNLAPPPPKKKKKKNTWP